MPKYGKADPEVREMLAEVLSAYHPDLVAVDVRVHVQFAHAKKDKHGHPKGFALKTKGYPVLARIKVVSASDREAGEAKRLEKMDAKLTIDGDRWLDLSDDEKRALLDHEVTHLEVVRKKGEIQYDEMDRPKLKTRSHDFETGMFYEVAKRHGTASGEMRTFEQVRKVFVQMELFAGSEVGEEAGVA